MRKLFAVLSCLALLVLVAVVAVCGVVGLAEAPMEAGLTLAPAPEFAECPLGATALDVEHLDTDILCERCPVDLERQVETRRTSIYLATDRSERLKRPSMGVRGVNFDRDNRRANLGVWRGGVHAPRG